MAPISRANSRAGISPVSNHSAMCGLIRSSTYRRTVSRIATSSSVNKWSMSYRANGGWGARGMIVSYGSGRNLPLLRWNRWVGPHFYYGFSRTPEVATRRGACSGDGNPGSGEKPPVGDHPGGHHDDRDHRTGDDPGGATTPPAA